MQYMEKKVCFQEKASLSNYYQAKGPPAASGFVVAKNENKTNNSAAIIRVCQLIFLKSVKS